ncbi:MAG: His/Gly/Thr/Pro-type tRNA ligase C-terminal domain-containing protein, partial [Waddliaceae bacterium]
QVRVIPVKENHQQYAEKVRDRLQGFRVGVDNCCDTLAAKVYATKRAKVPYVVIVGDSEQQNGKIAVSSFQDQGKGRIESIEVFLEILRKEIAKNPLPILEETKSGDKRRIENK